MAVGKSGYLDFPGGQDHTVRLFWEENYDEQNTSVVKITEAKLRSGTYYGLWYPSRTIKVADQTLVTMSGNAPATHYWSVTTAGDGTFYPIITNSGAAPPWQTSAIAHNPDGTLTVAVSVDLLLYRNSPTVISTTLSGTQYIELTAIPVPKTLTFSSGSNSWVTVKKGGTALSSGATVYYGDVLNITYGASAGYKAVATLNGSPITSGINHTVTGDVSIAVTAEAQGLVYIDNGSEFEAAQIFIDNGSEWEQYAPYLDNGSSWEVMT